jgi:hypothetical protein
VCALKRIVSGGQTGVDRGALEAALALGFPCGGWCPAGRKAEDGAIPSRYPVAELSSADYAARTRQNVLDSDGTLIIHFGELTGGTLNTLRICETLGKPFLLIDADVLGAEEAAARAAAFVHRQSIGVLNVAGPRESGQPGAHRYAEQVITGILKREVFR